jgi:hypothetical protein
MEPKDVQHKTNEQSKLMSMALHCNTFSFKMVQRDKKIKLRYFKKQDCPSLRPQMDSRHHHYL